MYDITTSEEAQRIKENLLSLKTHAGWGVLKKALSQEKERLEEKILGEVDKEYNKPVYTEADLDKERRIAVIALLDYPDYIIEQMSLDTADNSQEDPYIT